MSWDQKYCVEYARLQVFPEPYIPVLWYTLRSKEEEKKMNEEFFNFRLSKVNKAKKGKSGDANSFIKNQN